MSTRTQLTLRLTGRLILAMALLVVVSHGFGMHRHGDGEAHPESCSLCRAEALPLSASPTAVDLPVLPPCSFHEPHRATVLHDAPESRVPSRAPPAFFV